MAPKKINVIAALVRRRSVPEALALLSHMPKKGASLLSGLIGSAAANAERVSQDRSMLFIKNLLVQKGPGLRRFIPMARGRARPIDKWTSHVTVELGVLVPKGQEAKATKAGKEGVKAKKVEKEKKALRQSSGQVPKVEKVEGPESAIDSAPAPAAPKSDDPHAKGFSPKGGPKGPTFQPHRRGGRGS